MKLLPVVGLLLLLSGCVSTDDMNQVKRQMGLMDQELAQFKTETSQRLSALTNETASIRKQMLNMTASTDEREDRTKTLLGKVDELQHQLDTYWRETKNEFASIRKGGPALPSSPGRAAPILRDESSEVPYKDAFDTFQKGMYSEAAQKFQAFVEADPKTSLTPNAYFWLGESYMMLRDYDKAILYFQELLDKYPKSEMASKALLSQADAFSATKDKKSSMTILKKIIELYPKTEEAAIAERKLRNL
jgi:tol-pal system protein YbgF